VPIGEFWKLFLVMHLVNLLVRLVMEIWIVIVFLVILINFCKIQHAKLIAMQLITAIPQIEYVILAMLQIVIHVII
jgi:hypothetical protein